MGYGYSGIFHSYLWIRVRPVLLANHSPLCTQQARRSFNSGLEPFPGLDGYWMGHRVGVGPEGGLPSRDPVTSSNFASSFSTLLSMYGLVGERLPSRLVPTQLREAPASEILLLISRPFQTY